MTVAIVPVCTCGNEARYLNERGELTCAICPLKENVKSWRLIDVPAMLEKHANAPAEVLETIIGKLYVLRLDTYERDNLLWLLDLVLSGEAGRELRFGCGDPETLHTGDWVEQIRYLLYPEHGPGTPNGEPVKARS